MAMKYKTKCICQIDLNYLTRHTMLGNVCVWCNGSGEVEYDLRPDNYKGKFTKVKLWTDKPDDTVDASIEYDELTLRLRCSCGDEVFFSDSSDTVCSCGRVYRVNVSIKKDDTHLGDMEYWDRFVWDMVNKDKEYKQLEFKELKNE